MALIITAIPEAAQVQRKMETATVMEIAMDPLTAQRQEALPPVLTKIQPMAETIIMEMIE
ncbi:MAG: hypothetical protein Q4F21_08365 [Lachnospiraceae bacterium]|nr:hypothetical protein [Lachnospiraceae bacterium]